jgi:hypothetical protein
MLVEIELLDLGPHGDGGAATIMKVTVDGEVRCVWSEDLSDIRKPMVVGDRRYIQRRQGVPRQAHRDVLREGRGGVCTFKRAGGLRRKSRDEIEKFGRIYYATVS